MSDVPKVLPRCNKDRHLMTRPCMWCVQVKAVVCGGCAR